MDKFNLSNKVLAADGVANTAQNDSNHKECTGESLKRYFDASLPFQYVACVNKFDMSNKFFFYGR